jgi:hypothetical protein
MSSAKGYARSIEGRWATFCERPVILSQRDWALIEDWYSRGIPLQIVEETIDHAAEMRARGGGGKAAPRGLSYIAGAVEDSWTAVLEGRMAGRLETEEPAPEAQAAIESWRRSVALEAKGSALRELLTGLIASFERGEPAGEIDGRLEASLCDAVPRDLLAEVESEVGAELLAYRGRMTPEAYESTLRRATVMRLRRRLQLAELAGP